jgi:hypothetical protein
MTKTILKRIKEKMYRYLSAEWPDQLLSSVFGMLVPCVGYLYLLTDFGRHCYDLWSEACMGLSLIVLSSSSCAMWK